MGLVGGDKLNRVIIRIVDKGEFVWPTGIIRVIFNKMEVTLTVKDMAVVIVFIATDTMGMLSDNEVCAVINKSAGEFYKSG